ncbi:ATP-binding protein [Streptomyces antibioticus]|uniref:ATP-binding protein n=1 Tax=Streptomyces antibioticus TaxID=1890 RepID=UPI003D703C88
MDHETCMTRKPWDLAFKADPAEVAGLRRVMRLHLGLWGLHDLTDDAELCVSELVSNVITHVGPGTPATLAVSMNGVRLRIEVHDPDPHALPTLLDAGGESEGGRGMALVDALAVRWGVLPDGDRKITWCELPTGLTSPNGHVGCPGVERAEALLEFHCAGSVSVRPPGRNRPSSRRRCPAEESVITIITDFLLWLGAHGCDVDQALDRAQSDYEARPHAVVGSPRSGP